MVSNELLKQLSAVVSFVAEAVLRHAIGDANCTHTVGSTSHWLYHGLAGIELVGVVGQVMMLALAGQGRALC